MPAASALRRLVPYYRPYPRLLAGGLALVVVSSAIGAVVPWLLRAGPAIMYLTNTIFGGAFALVFMLRIDVRLTLLALLPMVLLPVGTIKLGSALHRRFEAVQQEFSALTTLAQENFAGVRIVRAYRQERAEIGRFLSLNE